METEVMRWFFFTRNHVVRKLPEVNHENNFVPVQMWRLW